MASLSYLQKIQFLKNMMEDLKIFLKKFLIMNLKKNLKKIKLLMNID